MIEQVGDADLAPGMQMGEGFHLYPLMVDLRFHRWDEILAAPDPGEKRKVLGAFAKYARAMALARKGRMKEAIAAQVQFEKTRKALSPDLLYMINNKASDLLALCSATLEAELARARGDKAESTRLWRRAVEAEGAIQYDEPPAWFYPVKQSLGGALLRNGQAKEAEAVFRESLATRPRDGRLLFGLWQSLVAQKRDPEAALVQKQFEEAWKGATSKLTVEDL